jgi:hypothetical protein
MDAVDAAAVAWCLPSRTGVKASAPAIVPTNGIAPGASAICATSGDSGAALRPGCHPSGAPASWSIASGEAESMRSPRLARARRRRRSQKRVPASSASARTPPMTPPAMAPTGAGSDGGGDAAGAIEPKVDVDAEMDEKGEVLEREVLERDTKVVVEEGDPFEDTAAALSAHSR